jgi:hypothetical protein
MQYLAFKYTHAGEKQSGSNKRGDMGKRREETERKKSGETER